MRARILIALGFGAVGCGALGLAAYAADAPRLTGTTPAPGWTVPEELQGTAGYGGGADV